MKLSELQPILPIESMAELKPDQMYLVTLKQRVDMATMQNIASNLSAVGVKCITMDAGSVAFHEIKPGQKYLVTIKRPIPQADLERWEKLLREKAGIDVVFVDKDVVFSEADNVKRWGEFLYAISQLSTEPTEFPVGSSKELDGYRKGYAAAIETVRRLLK